MIPQISIVGIIRLKRKQFNFKTENKSFYVLTCRINGESSFFTITKSIKISLISIRLKPHHRTERMGLIGAGNTPSGLV
jgi:hypothetical protein